MDSLSIKRKLVGKVRAPRCVESPSFTPVTQKHRRPGHRRSAHCKAVARRAWQGLRSRRVPAGREASLRCGALPVPSSMLPAQLNNVKPSEKPFPMSDKGEEEWGGPVPTRYPNPAQLEACGQHPGPPTPHQQPLCPPGRARPTQVVWAGAGQGRNEGAGRGEQGDPSPEPTAHFLEQRVC